ncbi:MAG: hydrogenase expression/formation protein HypE, partial [Planctomycetaceae bacterium]|nr:hydrogenase expression/formation protein HypE [Planctomycetaceae bacterium]
EGKMLLIVSPDDEPAALQAVRSDPLGREAVTIGRVQAEEPGCVLVHTGLGSTFVLDIPAGEELPRIC